MKKVMNHKGKFIVLAACIVLTTILLVGCVSPAQEHLNKGNAYCDQGEFDEAIQEFTKAIELDPEYALAYNNRGVAYDEKGEYDKAIADCNKAIELNPELDEPYFGRGLGYMELGQKEKAISDFEKSIELSENPALIQAAQEILDELRV